MGSARVEIEALAGYAVQERAGGEEARATARYCLADALGCAMLALNYPACTKLLGPQVPGTVVPDGSRVPGTDFVLEPVAAAFNIGTMIRWLDYNDTWLAAEWGHPSDNIGALLAIGDYLTRSGKKTVLVSELLTAMIKAYELQGALALENSFNKIGFDHVILVKVATAAAAASLLGFGREQTAAALSQAWIDTGPLRTYRHAPCVGSRKSWAAGDATARGLFLALLTGRGEMGYPEALHAKKWGFCDVLKGGEPLLLGRPLGSYVMENILFKISYPAEFHAQTAVECAVKLHERALSRLDEIEEIAIETQEPAVRIIAKEGPLKNPADRDHCLQYMTAVALLRGNLTADDYEEAAAADPRIDRLRAKMKVKENPQFTRDYYDPERRAIGNAVALRFKGGDTLREEVLYPLGHRRRREEALPFLEKKFLNNLKSRFSQERAEEIAALFKGERLEELTVSELMDYFAVRAQSGVR